MMNITPPFRTFRLPQKGYVPKWYKGEIKTGSIITGMKKHKKSIHVWITKKNKMAIPIALALSEIKKDRTIDFEFLNTDDYLLPITTDCCKKCKSP